MTVFQPGGKPRYRHQRRGLAKILKTKGVCALLFDPGTGKTATALDYASILALKSETGEARVLVVAPLAAIDTWVDQAAEWVSPQVHYWAEALGGSIRERASALASRGGQPYRKTEYRPGQATDAAHSQKSLAWGSCCPGITAFAGPGALSKDKPRLIIEVINLDTLASRQSVGSYTMADIVLAGIRRFAPDLVIVDESHKIKGNSANASRALARLSDHVDHRLLLTGTVMPHSPLDIFGQWRFLDPQAFGTQGNNATFKQFKNRYSEAGGWMGKEVKQFKNLDEMQDIMARNSIAVTKEDALDLPPSQDVIVPVNLSVKEQLAYEQLKASLVARFSSGEQTTAVNRLTQMLRLRQVTSGHLPTDGGTLETLGSSKIKTITSIVHDNLAGEKRVVVFCFFSHEIHALAKSIESKGTEVLVIEGSTPNKERLRLRHRFGSDDPARLVMIAQIKTISLAVNELVTASNAVFGSLSQQRDDLVQGRDRLTRIGQTRPVTFWYAIAPHTVDQVILNAHQRRDDLEKALLLHLRGEYR